MRDEKDYLAGKMMFRPQIDITAYELAQISMRVAGLGTTLTKDQVAGFPKETQRHWAMIAARPGE